MFFCGEKILLSNLFRCGRGFPRARTTMQRRKFLKASGAALGALSMGSGAVTASDDNKTIWLVTTDRVDDNSYFDGTLSKMEAYFNEVWTGYTIYTYAGYATDSSFEPEPPDKTAYWWDDQSFTDYDNNLLIDKVDTPGTDEGGYYTGDHAAVVNVKDGMGDMAGPRTDADFIGDQPVTGYAAPMQVATAFQEVAHLDMSLGASAEHDLGYAYEDDWVNKTSPMMTGHVENYNGETNACGDTVTNNGTKETRYIEGFTNCEASELDGSVITYDADYFDTLSD